VANELKAHSSSLTTNGPFKGQHIFRRANYIPLVSKKKYMLLSRTEGFSVVTDINYSSAKRVQLGE